MLKKWIKELYKNPPKELLYLMLDNFPPHHQQEIEDRAASNKVELVYTPTYASWLSRIECHLAPLRKFVLSGVYYVESLGDLRFLANKGLRTLSSRHGKVGQRVVAQEGKVCYN